MRIRQRALAVTLPRKYDWLAVLAASAAVVLLLHPSAVWADVASQGVLDKVQRQFGQNAWWWQGALMNAALWLFWTLGAISLTWTMGMLALRKADIQEFFAEFVRFVIFFGFFRWLLVNGPYFAGSIIASLQLLGNTAATEGLTNTGNSEAVGTQLKPSAIVDIAFKIWDRVAAARPPAFSWEWMTTNIMTTYADSLMAMIVCIVILLIFALVAINYLLILVSGWLLAYAGIFLLGFGATRWTSDIAINYYKTVLGVALQLLAMILLIGIGTNILQTMYNAMSVNVRWQELGAVLVTSIAILILTNKIPSMLAGILTGSSASGGGMGSFGAGAALGAASMAGRGAESAARAGGKLLSGAKKLGLSATGAGTAVAAAMSVAKAAGDAAAGMGSGNTASTGKTPLSSAMGGGAHDSGTTDGAGQSSNAGGFSPTNQE